ncbi:MAG: host-nuclease inhibitor Gam family protein [Lysinibacillus sp.]
MLANKLETLDEQLQDETLELTQDEVSSQYEIENLEGLDWAFRKVAIYQNELAEQEAYAKAQIEKITSWLDAERAKAGRNIEYFELLIKQYHAKILAENPKKKSISTPNGKVQSTTRKPSIVKPEKDSLPQLIEYAKANDFTEYVEVKEELKWTDFKKELKLTDDLKVVDSNGQVVEGIPVNEGGTSFKITI